MDIEKVNYVLERAIIGLQVEEIEALYEKFKVPTPQQMHKKTGMALSLGADDAMRGVDSALSSLTSGHGKLTDPNRTPISKEAMAALNEFIQVSKGMAPKDRKMALARLRDWQKSARAHAKRMQQAAYSYKVGDVGTSDIQPARNIRDQIGQAVKIVSKFRGGGFGKEQTTAKPGTGKKRSLKKRDTGGVPSMLDLLKKTPQEIQKELQQKAAGRVGGATVPSGTVETFIRVLEAGLYKDSFYDRGDIKKRVQKVRARMKSDLESDDKRDLKDLIRVVKKELGTTMTGTIVYPDVVEEWFGQVQDFIRSGRFPKTPAGTMVVPKRDKRQIGMTFEAIQRLKLALVG